MTYVFLALMVVLVFAMVAFMRRRTVERAQGAAQRNQYTDHSHDDHMHRQQHDMTTGVVVGGLVMNDALNSQPAAEDTKRWGAMGESSGSYDGDSSSSHDSSSSSSFDGGSSSVD